MHEKSRSQGLPGSGKNGMNFRALFFDVWEVLHQDRVPSIRMESPGPRYSFTGIEGPKLPGAVDRDHPLRVRPVGVQERIGGLGEDGEGSALLQDSCDLREGLAGIFPEVHGLHRGDKVEGAIGIREAVNTPFFDLHPRPEVLLIELSRERNALAGVIDSIDSALRNSLQQISDRCSASAPHIQDAHAVSCRQEREPEGAKVGVGAVHPLEHFSSLLSLRAAGIGIFHGFFLFSFCPKKTDGRDRKLSRPSAWSMICSQNLQTGRALCGLSLRPAGP